MGVSPEAFLPETQICMLRYMLVVFFSSFYVVYIMLQF